tara:strand:- start:37167 stop:39101 length:1935 start_codon:yes stop_codon:yes gene_type:complete
MFQSNNSGSGSISDDVKNINTQIDLANIGLKSFTKRLMDSVTNVKKVIGDVGGYNTKAAQAVRESIGQTRIVSDEIQRMSANAAKATLGIGVTIEDNISLFAALNNSMMRTTFFTDEQVVRFQALGQIANMTSTELATMATSFDTLGYTTDETLDHMQSMTEEARSYGVNVSSFMSEVNKNLKLMVTYNFKDGVQGLSKMVAEAQALRIDMSKTVSFADELMSPEKAIETAAGFQMLGGAVGALGDPFQLLHMAQTDMEGLQTSLVDMAGASVDFNKETGEFNIPVTEMYRLREAAKLAGQSYQEFSEMAINSAQRTEKLKLLDGFNTVPEEQKELIASLGKIGANGTMEITMPDGSIKKIGEGFNELVGSDYGELQSMLDVNNMSEIDIAKQSMGYLNEISNAQSVLTNMTRLQLASGDGFTDMAGSLSKSNSLILDAMKKEGGENLSIPQELIDLSAAINTQLKVTPEQAEKVARTTFQFINDTFAMVKLKLGTYDFNEQFDEIFDGLKEALEKLNINVPSINGSNTPERDVQTGNTPPVINAPNRDVEVQAITTPNRDVAVNTIQTSSLNVTQPTNNEPVQLAVNGQVNLNIEGIPTNSPLTKEQLSMLLVNNPDAMVKIKSQLENRLGTLTDFNLGGGYG